MKHLALNLNAKSIGKLFLTFIGFSLVSCATVIPDSLLKDEEHLLQRDGSVSVTGPKQATANIRYLGVGGFAIEYGGETVLTAPFYSDPSILRSIPFVSMNADTACIDRSFPDDLSDESIKNPIAVTLVGHAHYDHLMDLPHLLETKLQKTKVLGSLSTQRLLNGSMGKSCKSESRAMAISDKPFHDFGEAIRIYPLASTHAPHFLNITAMTGTAECRNDKPRTAWGWKMGKVYAYVIDFLDPDGSIAFRVFYQDSASEAGSIRLPQHVPNRDFDAALLVAAGFHEVSNYPGSIVEMTNSAVYVAGHWDDFFSGCDSLPRITRGTNIDDFIESMESALDKQPAGQAKWRILFPDKTLTINVSP